jgi:ketosteroid isomerase-like protein
MTLLVLGFTQSTPQQDAATSEKEVRDLIEKYRTALLQRDIAALEKIWADNYIFVNAFGDVFTKSQRLANAKSGATTLDSIKEEENITVRVYQNSAVATSRVTIKDSTAVSRPGANIEVPMLGKGS